MTFNKKVYTRSTKDGLCNICGCYCTLTEDHVPPKGSINPQRVTIKSIIQFLDKDKIDPKIVRLSQNGLKFRSLCKKCNNELLGNNFDPSLNKFSQDLNRIINVKENIILPPKIEFSIQPQRIARSIIGHLLAVEIRENMADPLRKTPMINLMRNYFLDKNLDLPNDFNLFFWPYYIPQRQVVLRGFSIGSIENNSYVMGDILKYYPLAFWLTYKAPKQIIDSMKAREILIRGHNIDDWNTVYVDIVEQNTVRSDWPEAPNSTDIFLITNSMGFIAEFI